MSTKAAFLPVYWPEIKTTVLVPMDEDGRDLVAALSRTKPVMVKVHAARNPRHHRLLFALFGMLHNGGVWDGTQDTLLDYLKFATGHVEQTIWPDGTLYLKPKSIAYESMPQDKFARWFDRAVYVICSRLLAPANDNQAWANDNWKRVRDDIVGAVDGDLGRRANEAASRRAA